MSERRCEIPECNKPQKKDQAPPPSAQLCADHDAELNQAVKDGDIRKMVSMAAKALRGRDEQAGRW